MIFELDKNNRFKNCILPWLFMSFIILILMVITIIFYSLLKFTILILIAGLVVMISCIIYALGFKQYKKLEYIERYKLFKIYKTEKNKNITIEIKINTLNNYTYKRSFIKLIGSFELIKKDGDTVLLEKKASRTFIPRVFERENEIVQKLNKI